MVFILQCKFYRSMKSYIRVDHIVARNAISSIDYCWFLRCCTNQILEGPISYTYNNCASNDSRICWFLSHQIGFIWGLIWCQSLLLDFLFVIIFIVRAYIIDLEWLAIAMPLEHYRFISDVPIIPRYVCARKNIDC